jgi:hypothetical protein
MKRLSSLAAALLVWARWVIKANSKLKTVAVDVADNRLDWLKLGRYR